MPSFSFISCVERAQARFAYILSVGGQDACAPYLVVLSQENKHSDLRVECGFWLLEMRKAGPGRRFVKNLCTDPALTGPFLIFFCHHDQTGLTARRVVV